MKKKRKWGGTRTGAGRPKTGRTTTHLNVCVPIEYKSLLQDLVKAKIKELKEAAKPPNNLKFTINKGAPLLPVAGQHAIDIPNKIKITVAPVARKKEVVIKDLTKVKTNVITDAPPKSNYSINTKPKKQMPAGLSKSDTLKWLRENR